MIIGCLLDSVSRKAGGLQEAVRRLSQSLPIAGDAVRVFSLEDEHSAADLPAWRPLDVQIFRPVERGWGYAPELFPALCDAKLDVLLTHGLWKYSSLASLQWSRRTGRPSIIHPHGMLDPWAVRNSQWKKRVAGLLYEHAHLRRAACIRALCESEAQAIRAFGLGNPVCVIPNGIDLPGLGAGSGEQLESREQGAGSRLQAPSSELPAPSSLAPRSALPAGPKTLLYLGRLHPKKNLGPLLRAWADLQRDCPAAREWALAIAGWDQGGYEGELKELSRELGVGRTEQGAGSRERESGSKLQAPGSKLIGSSLRAPSSELLGSALPAPRSLLFLGPQFGDAKAACYANCDAFILPSLSEGLPMVVLEAWAYAKPVLMTNECNLPEGFAASAALRISTDAPSIAAGLRTLVEMTDAERVAMGARGRELVATKFSWPVIGDEMRRVCEWALGGGTPPESVRIKS